MKTVRIPLEIDDYTVFLTDEELGIVFRNILSFARRGQCDEMDVRPKAMFNKVKESIMAQNVEYNRKRNACLKAKEIWMNR